jgi:hypothetical protein
VVHASADAPVLALALLGGPVAAAAATAATHGARGLPSGAVRLGQSLKIEQH